MAFSIKFQIPQCRVVWHNNIFIIKNGGGIFVWKKIYKKSLQHANQWNVRLSHSFSSLVYTFGNYLFAFVPCVTYKWISVWAHKSNFHQCFHQKSRWPEQLSTSKNCQRQTKLTTGTAAVAHSFFSFFGINSIPWNYLCLCAHIIYNVHTTFIINQ